MFKFQLLENESISKIYRQTEAVLFKPVLIVFALVYFPWYFLLKYELAASYSRLLLVWTILIFAYALNKYLLWLLNVNLITNKRLVCVNYTSLLQKHVSEAPLQQVLSASFSVKGFWQSLFGYGTVEVRTAGHTEPIVLSNLSRPSQVKDFIWQVRTLPNN